MSHLREELFGVYINNGNIGSSEIKWQEEAALWTASGVVLLVSAYNVHLSHGLTQQRS